MAPVTGRLVGAPPPARRWSAGGGRPRALAQVQAERYAEKYRTPGVTVTQIGVEFSKVARNVVGFEVAAG